MLVLTNVVRASTTPSLAPINAWLVMLRLSASSCASDRNMMLGVTVVVPFCATLTSASFFDSQSMSAAVDVLFACGPTLFGLRRSSMPLAPPAGLYCCLSTRWMPFSSCVMAACVYWTLSLRRRIKRPILVTIDCLVAVRTVKHVSAMLLFEER